QTKVRRCSVMSANWVSGIFALQAKRRDAGKHCFSGIGKAGGLVDIKMKGCLEVSNCNKTVEKTCCSTDLCNSAPGHFHMSAVSMAFATISSVFTVKFLI
uniref:UPAR/Ly6 domain-containing protein n=1 Tax=Sinocyclocheilus anshuiensis TaxID=1608454 RepID=A0A671PRA3_9TELE